MRTPHPGHLLLGGAGAVVVMAGGAAMLRYWQSGWVMSWYDDGNPVFFAVAVTMFVGGIGLSTGLPIGAVVHALRPRSVLANLGAFVGFVLVAPLVFGVTTFGFYAAGIAIFATFGVIAVGLAWLASRLFPFGTSDKRDIDGVFD